MNTVKLSDKHLNVIKRALHVYYRLMSGQIDIALTEAYPTRIDHNIIKLVHQVIRQEQFPEFNDDGTSYSFNSEKIGDARIAYEIQKTIEEYLSVKNNDGYYGFTVNFDGPLKASDEPLPEILEHKNYKDFVLDINPEQVNTINTFIKNKQFREAWNFIDSLNLNLARGECKEIRPVKINGEDVIIIRITKPIKNNEYLTLG